MRETRCRLLVGQSEQAGLGLCRLQYELNLAMPMLQTSFHSSLRVSSTQSALIQTWQIYRQFLTDSRGVRPGVGVVKDQIASGTLAYALSAEGAELSAAAAAVIAVFFL
jgi:hypothetical protein